LLEAGAILGRYEILSLLGRGGMGEVYRARDTRLERQVAVKVLPAALASNHDAVRRFEREALAASALNHPHIVTLYDVGEETIDGATVSFIAMELIEGESLREGMRSASGRDLTPILLQIAEGLIKAHEAGIIHRDLKPENIVVSSDGYAKILDFGLAKLIEPASDSTGQQTVEQLSATREGEIVGTLRYMSPEQVRGEPLDQRSDIFSFGCILYEAVTGRWPFGGATALETVAELLHHDPAPAPDAELDQIARRCLAKKREDRYQSMREVAAALRAVSSVEPRPRRPMPRLVQATFSRAVEAFPSWSPDGHRIAFAREVGATRQIVVRDLRSGEETAVTRGASDEIQPSWSPDGSTLLFARAPRGERLEPGDVYGYYENVDVWAVDLHRGQERLLLRDACGASWSPDGERVAFDAAWSGTRRIWVCDWRGHNARQVTTDTSDAVSHFRPRWSPDGTRIVFQNLERTRFDIRVVEVGSGSLVSVTSDAVIDIEPVWSPSGKYIYFSSYRTGGLNLWRVPVALDGTPVGPLEQLTTGAGQDVQAVFSADGSRLAFAILRQNANIWLLPVDPSSGRPSGEPYEVIGTTREDSRGAWSADGRVIAFNSDRSGAMNLWLHNLLEETERQLTFGEGGDFQANWSPDGRRIAFFSGRDGRASIWEVEVESGKLRRLTSGDSIDVNPCYSPDGSRIAYHSDADGRMELWVMDADGGSSRQVTSCGASGHFVRWSADGKSIYFRCPTSPTAAMRVAADGGEPVAVEGSVGGAHISLSPDDTRMIDVVNHKALWVSSLDGGTAEKVFEFADAESRIDYPVWSPDGRFVVFDRFRPQGGDIWFLEDVE
jgi:eukaryotic-like serine/threonine-protein kinase